MKLSDTGPLLWAHKITEVGERGIMNTREASEEECAMLCRTLDLVECSEFFVEYSIEPTASDAWILSGNFRGRITQSCVISLDPVEAHLSEQFRIEFRERSPTPDCLYDEHSILNSEDIEILESDTIEVGRIIYETLAAALNPYPRKEGVEFSWRDLQPSASSLNSGPFTVLKKLKTDG